MGTPEFSIPTLKKINEYHNLIGVFTQPPRPSGRGMSLKKSPVHIFAEKLNLNIYCPKLLNNENIQNKITNFKPDFIIVVAYGLILPDKILKVPKFASINGHASLLPKWRGASPIQRSIESGDKETGCTSMLMESGLDTGPILLQKKLDILNNDDCIKIYEKLSKLTSECIIETIEKFSKGSIQQIEQDPNKVSYAKKLKKEDGIIQWELKSLEIFNKLRAFKSFPGLFTFFNLNQLNIIDGSPVDKKHNEKPGTILSVKNSILVACGNKTSFSIKYIKKTGKKILSTNEFLNGFKLKEGDIFDNKK
tara:strand:- start:802 stop:1722 length:921 start_codon:yes stop_codon:yes gene_type:complete